MPMKLYKVDLSPPARAVMMVSDLLGAPVQFTDINLLNSEHKTPEMLQKNPLHTVPVLEDGDFILHDSHAILMYLVDVYGKDDSLYPKDVKQRALVNQKLLMNNSILFPRLRNITYYAILLGERKPEQRKLDDITEAYGFLEAILSKTKFLSLNHMTIADISALATVTSLLYLVPLDSKKYPKTYAWLNEMKGKPFAVKYNMPGDEILGKLINEKVDLN